MFTRGAATGAILMALTRVVYAGGFEFPDNGTEALGRGGAFTAKASDGTALEYNIAGLATQRGTRLMGDLNLVFSTYTLQRPGTYPGMPSAAQPWAGQPYPLVQNTGGVFAAPFVALSSDFGLDRWTFAVGVFGPSSVGNRTYPLSIGGSPSPARYDVVQALPLLVLPTVAAAVRVTRWLDIGLALHLLYGKFDLTSVSYLDLGASSCPNAEYQPCDSVNHLQTSGVTATGALGVMLHPVRWWSFGANVRGPAYLSTSGTVNATPPASLQGQTIMPANATLSTTLPWELRFGTRFVAWHDAELEKFDLELDATWENWGAAQANGPAIHIDQLSIFNDINPNITHHYHDTFSLRVGSGYNARLPVGVLGLRLGIFYDSSATDDKDTRLDFDTLAKLGFTVGAGYTIRGITINVAYAYMYEFDRNVTDGDIAPINGAQHGASVDSQGNALPAINDGRYHGQTSIFSLGMTIRFDELVGRKHVSKWPDEARAENEATPRRMTMARAQAARVTPDEDDDARPPAAATAPATNEAAPATNEAAPANDDANEATAGDAMTFAPERITRAKTRKARPKKKHAARSSVNRSFWTAGF
jgi:long-subunit fatty acid transport protein